MLLLIVSAALPPQAPRVAVQARATIRIERPATGSEKQWKNVPDASRRETIIKNESGDPVLLRIVEYQ